MMRIRFLKPNMMYQSGDIAAFDDAVAGRLVDSGLAEFADLPKIVEPVVEPAVIEQPVIEPDPEPVTLNRFRRKYNRK
jgi:hypothetical protein